MARPTRSAFPEGAHGTRARYNQKCRCDDCRRANRDYERARTRKRIWDDGNPLVSSEATRRHIIALSAAGVGTALLADVAKVARTTLLGIKHGRNPNCRKEVERKVLAVDASAKFLTDVLLVPAGPTWRKLRQMLAWGLSRSEIARRLGSKSRTPTLQIGKTRITNANKIAVERLYAAVLVERAKARSEAAKAARERKAEERKEAAAARRAERLAATSQPSSGIIPDIDWRPEWSTNRSDDSP